ncbi:MAG: bifunctional glycosyltransferase/class I SAM-dependent methyltransferase [Planctomycetota bacterium]
MAKVLVFIVAYNAESTIEAVLERIPAGILGMDYEILIIDDQSGDQTVRRAEVFRKTHGGYHLTVLSNPVNQGYGGNQKIGYQYAIEKGFDAVVLLHGDGQYAPERLPEMLQPILDGKAEAVFGSRMLLPWGALKGGMPLYKFVGNRILTRFQNWLLRSALSEFHSGYRAYAVRALAAVPFQYNTNGFHFDTEIIIQFMLKKHRIVEIPIPTYYGNEICRVNGLKYAWDVMRTTAGARLHEYELFYRRNFDVHPPETKYRLKLGYLSSHTVALAEVRPESRVLDIGCGQGLWAAELKKQKQCHVEGVDQIPVAEGPAGLDGYTCCDLNWGELALRSDGFDFIVLLDVLEHLDTTAELRLLAAIREGAAQRKPAVLISTANVAFAITRGMLLLGQFNYGRRGILDSTHRHLFTRSSLRTLLDQAGYRIEKVRAIPPPYPEVLGKGLLSRLFLCAHGVANWLLPSVFAYQFFVVARPLPTVGQLLDAALETSQAGAGGTKAD